jgi:hypothetical protein
MSNFTKQRKYNTKYNTGSTTPNYGKDRLKGLNLTIEEGFDYCPKTGDIIIQYSDIDNNREYYNSPDERKTLAIECPEQFRNRKPYKARRLAPENIRGGNKCIMPAGTHARVFIPLQTRQLYKSDIACTIDIRTEGQIKAAVANKLLGKGCAVFGHSGIANYKECQNTKKFAAKKTAAKVVFNYDSDGTKADNRQRLAQFFNSAFWAITEKITSDRLQGLTLPKYYICIQNPNQPHKGLDDILMAHGLQAAAEFKTCQTSEFFIFAEIDPTKVHECLSKFFNYNDHKLKPYDNAIVLRENYYSDKENKVRTRLTDIFANNGLAPTFQYGKQLEVVTGAGKTTNYIKAAAMQKAVYYAPTLSIIEQVYSDALKAGVDAIKYTGKEAQDKQLLADRINAGLLPQLIVCTIASARSLAEMLKFWTKVYHIVIDEFHTSTSGANAKFMLRQLNELLDTAPLYRSVGTMTGTPLLNLHPATKDLPKVIIKLTGEPKTKAQFLSAADPLQAAALVFKKAIEQGKKAYILFNNKTAGLDDLNLIFANNGIINYSTFNADKKDSPEWLELLDTGLIPAGIDGIITTSVYEMGINNNTETPAEVITLGEFHPITIKQFKERQRLAECTLTIIQKHRNEPKRARWIGTDEPEKMVKAAENVCTILNNDPAGLYTLGIRENIQKLFIRHTASGYVPDYLAIQNFVFELQKIWFNSSPERLLKELEKYSFNVYSDDERKKLAIIKAQDERDADIKALSQSSRDERKEASQRTFEAILQELILQPFPQITAAKKEKSKSSTKDEREFCQMFLDIRTEAKDDATALKLFGQSEGKNSKVKLTIQRLKAKKANFNTHELGNAPAAILRTFGAGGRYTAESLKNAFIDCLRTDRTINLQPFERCGMPVMDKNTGTERLTRIDAILKKLRVFFDVMPAGHKGMEYEITELPTEYLQ